MVVNGFIEIFTGDLVICFLQSQKYLSDFHLCEWETHELRHITVLYVYASLLVPKLHHVRHSLLCRWQVVSCVQCHTTNTGFFYQEAILNCTFLKYTALYWSITELNLTFILFSLIQFANFSYCIIIYSVFSCMA